MPDIALRDISKSFPGVLAVDHVSVDFRAGAIHALLGENGAGKSTLMHLVSGLYRPDSGTILIDGQPSAFPSPRAALSAGIAMVHQHFMLIPSFTIAENIFLALSGSRLDRIQHRTLNKQVQELAAHHQIVIEDPNTPVATLSVGSQQRVEILKALAASARVLILDEPTAVLAPTEVENLFLILRRLKQAGYLIILITHKIPEVLAIADRLSVLRRGRLVVTKEADRSTPEELAQLMVGDLVSRPSQSPQPYSFSSSSSAPPLLLLDHVSTAPRANQVSLHDISLTLNRGELVGIAGVDGNGQTEFIDLLLGLQEVTQGSISFQGTQLHHPTPAYMRSLGISFIPQDRRQEGLALSLSVEENLLLNTHLLSTFTPGPFLTPPRLRQFAQQQISSFGVRTASPADPVSSLSGGNQQRIVIARELATQPHVIIAANPTRGLDIGATDYVRNTLCEHCHRGASVLLISTDLDEIMTLSHRMYVLYQGRLLGPIDPVTGHHHLGLLMTGVQTS